MRYEKIISDHVGVKVTINNDGFKAAKMKKREQYVDKGWLQKIAKEFLNEFINTTTVEEMKEDFERRLNKGIRHHDKKAKPYKK